MEVHRAVRVRRHQPGRGAAPDHRGRGDDPLQGRGRHRQRRRGDQAHAPIRAEIGRLAALPDDELFAAAKELGAPYELVAEVAPGGKLPVVLFTAGGIATPADAAMMMQLGAEGVFVGSGIFKSGDPAKRAEAIVKATTFYDDPDVVAKVSRGLGEAMVGINLDTCRPTSTRQPRLVAGDVLAAYQAGRTAQRRDRAAVGGTMDRGTGSACSRCRATCPSTCAPSRPPAPGRCRSAVRRSSTASTAW